MNSKSKIKKSKNKKIKRAGSYKVLNSEFPLKNAMRSLRQFPSNNRWYKRYLNKKHNYQQLNFNAEFKKSKNKLKNSINSNNSSNIFENIFKDELNNEFQKNLNQQQENEKYKFQELSEKIKESKIQEFIEKSVGRSENEIRNMFKSYHNNYKICRSCLKSYKKNNIAGEINNKPICKKCEEMFLTR